MEPSQEKAGQPLPPKVDLKKQATASNPEGGGTVARFQTMEIKLPDLEPAAPPPAPAVSSAPDTTAARPVTSKRATSRIPYDSAKSVAQAQGGVASSGPTTIRIKPALGKATVDLRPFPVAETANLSGLEEDILKRKTSRISVGAASEQPDESEDSGPRTIRLKRPAEPVAGGALLPPAAEAAAGAPDSEDEGAGSGTRKKTVKLRRPGADGGPAAVESAPKADVVRAPAEGRKADAIHWVFGLFAVAAMLVAAVGVYVLLAQLTGPNLSLTQLSAFWPGADLPWVNKLPLIP